MLCNKLSPNSVAYNSHITSNYLTTSVCQESRYSLTGSLVSGSLRGYTEMHLKARLGKDTPSSFPWLLAGGSPSLTVGRKAPSSLPQRLLQHGSCITRASKLRRQERARDMEVSFHKLIMEMTPHHSLLYSVTRSMPGSGHTPGRDYMAMHTRRQGSLGAMPEAATTQPSSLLAALRSLVPAGQLTASCSQSLVGRLPAFIN